MKHPWGLIGPCVAGGVAILVLGVVGAYGEEPALKGDTAVPEAHITGATAAPGKEEPIDPAESPGRIGIGPGTERNLSAPDDSPGPTSEDRDRTREQDALSSLSY
jgi:hypothetical protein